jgi:hypothetical protein
MSDTTSKLLADVAALGSVSVDKIGEHVIAWSLITRAEDLLATSNRTKPGTIADVGVIVSSRDGMR